MHKIEGGLGQRIGGYVVALYFEVWEIQGLKKAGIDVSRQYVSRGPNSISEPTCDGPASTTHFQAAPTAADTPFLQMANGSRVKHCRQRRKPNGRFSSGIVEQIV
jgi:hypothetical protein